MPSSLPLPVVIAKPPPPPLTPRTAAPSPFARVGTYKSGDDFTILSCGYCHEVAIYRGLKGKWVRAAFSLAGAMGELFFCRAGHVERWVKERGGILLAERLIIDNERIHGVAAGRNLCVVCDTVCEPVAGVRIGGLSGAGRWLHFCSARCLLEGKWL